MVKKTTDQAGIDPFASPEAATTITTRIENQAVKATTEVASKIAPAATVLLVDHTVAEAEAGAEGEQVDEGAVTAAGGTTEEEEEATNPLTISEQATTATTATTGIETTTKEPDIPGMTGTNPRFLPLGVEMGLRTGGCRTKGFCAMLFSLRC